MLETDVLIVGAGPTGLTCAIELQRLGLSVRLVDQATHPAEWSQALVVQARTLEQWERYGIAELAVGRGRKLHRGRVFSDGKQIVQLDFDTIPGRYPYLLFLPQRETETLLADHLAQIGGAQIERHVEFVSVSQDRTGITARLREASADGEREVEHRAEWLIGADGAHSRVRDAVGISFAGTAAELTFILGDLALEGADLPGDELVVHLAGGDVVFVGRLSNTTCRVIYASHDGRGDAPTAAVTLEHFNQAFARTGVRLRATGASWMAPFHVSDRQATAYRDRQTFLAGDASHIHSPVAGQGMNTGIQDAANLAWKLAAVHRGAPEVLLDSYETERRAVGRAVLRRTGTTLHLATTTNPLLRWLRDHLAVRAEHIARFQNAATGFISETAVSYAQSSIVVDQGGLGTLRTGERVPNPTLRDGRRLLEPLTWPRSLLLVVGTPHALPGVPPDGPHLAVRSIDASEGAEVRSLFGSGAQFFVVRPDGYLGFRSPAIEHDALVEYLERTGALT